MENPATWTPAERIIARVLSEHEQGRVRGVVGVSAARAVYTALVRAGFLEKEEEDGTGDG
jgi:hypothetical protein